MPKFMSIFIKIMISYGNISSCTCFFVFQVFDIYQVLLYYSIFFLYFKCFKLLTKIEFKLKYT